MCRRYERLFLVAMSLPRWWQQHPVQYREAPPCSTVSYGWSRLDTSEEDSVIVAGPESVVSVSSKVIEFTLRAKDIRKTCCVKSAPLWYQT